MFIHDIPSSLHHHHYIIPLLTAPDCGGHTEGQCSLSTAPPPPPPPTPATLTQIFIRYSVCKSTLPSVHLINYIYLLLARCSRTFTSNAVTPSIALEPLLPIYSCSCCDFCMQGQVANSIGSSYISQDVIQMVNILTLSDQLVKEHKFKHIHLIH